MNSTTLYGFPHARDAVAGDYRRIWNDLRPLEKEWKHLVNYWADSVFVVEGDRGAFQQLGVHFLLVAAGAGHVHLYVTDPDVTLSLGPFESGSEVLIAELGDDSGGKNRLPPVPEFNYEARPVLASAPGLMRPGSLCSVRGKGGGISFVSNSQGLLSLTGHCLDLAEEGTARGVSLRYNPGDQLTPDSTTFLLRIV